MTAAKARKPAAESSEARKSATVAGLPAAPVCVIPGCEEEVLHRGLCAAHWEDPQQK